MVSFFGRPETSAGHAIWQTFGMIKKKKILIGHKNNSTDKG